MKLFNKKIISSLICFLFLFTNLAVASPVQAATKKKQVTKVPKVVTSGIKTKYDNGNSITFKVYSKDYTQNVQYRILLLDCLSKKTVDVTKGYTKAYAAKKIISFKLPNLKQGKYTLSVLVKRYAKKVSYDNILKYNFIVENNIYLKTNGQVFGNKNITSMNGNIYVLGNNITLKNLKVNGNIILDPGKTGNANLNNVTATKIQVLSGGANSIHFDNVKVSSSLTVATKYADSPVRIETNGSTVIPSTEVASNAILDVKDGSFGSVIINKDNKTTSNVELRGSFDKDVVVAGQAQIKTNSTSVIPKLVVQPENKEDKVVIDGNFKAVEINKSASVELTDNAKIRDAVTVKAEVQLKAGDKAEVPKVDISTDKAGANVKLEGKSFGIIDVNKEAKINLSQGTKANIVVNSKNVEINADKNVAVNVDNKGNEVVKSGEGKDKIVKVDLSNLEKSITDKIDINQKIDKAQDDKAEADRAAQQAKTPEQKAAADKAMQDAKAAADKAAADKAAADKAIQDAQTAADKAAQQTSDSNKTPDTPVTPVTPVTPSEPKVNLEYITSSYYSYGVESIDNSDKVLYLYKGTTVKALKKTIKSDVGTIKIFNGNTEVSSDNTELTNSMTVRAIVDNSYKSYSIKIVYVIKDKDQSEANTISSIDYSKHIMEILSGSTVQDLKQVAKVSNGYNLDVINGNAVVSDSSTKLTEDMKVEIKDKNGLAVEVYSINLVNDEYLSINPNLNNPGWVQYIDNTNKKVLVDANITVEYIKQCIVANYGGSFDVVDAAGNSVAKYKTVDDSMKLKINGTDKQYSIEMAYNLDVDYSKGNKLYINISNSDKGNTMSVYNGCTIEDVLNNIRFASGYSIKVYDKDGKEIVDPKNSEKVMENNMKITLINSTTGHEMDYSVRVRNIKASNTNIDYVADLNCYDDEIVFPVNKTLGYLKSLVDLYPGTAIKVYADSSKTAALKDEDILNDGAIVELTNGSSVETYKILTNVISHDYVENSIINGYSYDGKSIYVKDDSTVEQLKKYAKVEDGYTIKVYKDFTMTEEANDTDKINNYMIIDVVDSNNNSIMTYSLVSETAKESLPYMIYKHNGQDEKGWLIGDVYSNFYAVAGGDLAWLKNNMTVNDGGTFTLYEDYTKEKAVTDDSAKLKNGMTIEIKSSKGFIKNYQVCLSISIYRTISDKIIGESTDVINGNKLYVKYGAKVQDVLSGITLRSDGVMKVFTDSTKTKEADPNALMNDNMVLQLVSNIDTSVANDYKIEVYSISEKWGNDSKTERIDYNDKKIYLNAGAKVKDIANSIELLDNTQQFSLKDADGKDIDITKADNAEMDLVDGMTLNGYTISLVPYLVIPEDTNNINARMSANNIYVSYDKTVGEVKNSLKVVGEGTIEVYKDGSATEKCNDNDLVNRDMMVKVTSPSGEYNEYWFQVILTKANDDAANIIRSIDEDGNVSLFEGNTVKQLKDSLSIPDGWNVSAATDYQGKNVLSDSDILVNSHSNYLIYSNDKNQIVSYGVHLMPAIRIYSWSLNTCRGMNDNKICLDYGTKVQDINTQNMKLSEDGTIKVFKDSTKTEEAAPDSTVDDKMVVEVISNADKFNMRDYSVEVASISPLGSQDSKFNDIDHLARKLKLYCGSKVQDIAKSVQLLDNTQQFSLKDTDGKDIDITSTDNAGMELKDGMTLNGYSIVLVPYLVVKDTNSDIKLLGSNVYLSYGKTVGEVKEAFNIVNEGNIEIYKDGNAREQCSDTDVINNNMMLKVTSSNGVYSSYWFQFTLAKAKPGTTNIIQGVNQYGGVSIVDGTTVKQLLDSLETPEGWKVSVSNDTMGQNLLGDSDVLKIGNPCKYLVYTNANNRTSSYGISVNPKSN